VDAPEVLVTSLPSKQNVTSVKFRIPEGTRVIYFVHAYESQLWLDKGSNKNISARFIFPKNLEKLTMDLEGRQNILFSKGLEKPSSQLAAHNWSCQNYFRYLVEKGYYSGELTDMFEDNAAPFNYEQVILAPLSDYSVNAVKGNTVTLNYEFGGTGKLSPENMRVLAFCVSQHMYHHSNHAWKKELVV
jgi:hypothetical protein